MRALISTSFSVLTLASVACSTTAPATTAARPPAPASAPAAKTAAPSKPVAVAPDVKAPSTDPLYFAYDAHLLEPDAQTRLRDIAAYLAATPGANVRISGHADERGTSEYNLALGDARARAAREYLLRMGVSADRIHFETLGEERPADPGHDETAWSRNRRDEIAFDS